MNQNAAKWIFVLVALLVGLVGGYWYGNMKGVEQGVAKEQAAKAQTQKAAEEEAAKAANPFEQTTTNPFEKSPANPFENVELNPFK